MFDFREPMLNVKMTLNLALTLSLSSDVRKVVPDRKWLERPVGVWNHPADSSYRPEMEMFDIREPMLNVKMTLNVALTLSLSCDVREVVPDRKWLERLVGVWNHPADSSYRPEMKMFDFFEPSLYVKLMPKLILSVALMVSQRK